MMPGFEAVRAWLDRLRADDLSGVETTLSPEGLREAWRVALEALDDQALKAVEAMGGLPFPTAALVTARTVPTAPLEWCAVLLGRGSRVYLKHPAEAPGLAPLLARHAQAVGLPLVTGPGREPVLRAELVVAMGGDATMAALRGALAPSTRFLPHGHRFSVAWITELASMPAVALDAALHDGRGCLSPLCVLTPLPLQDACEALGEAMRLAQLRLPRGRVTPAEGAAIRTRRALARVTGVLREGEDWSVHGLPASHLALQALPRSLAVVQVPDVEAAAALLGAPLSDLSTVGTDAEADPWIAAGATRICRPGHMQRPPLLRPHDGVDWIRATARWVSREV